MSIRSSSGPESRARYCRTGPAAAPAGARRSPHGQGFAARNNWKRAGSRSVTAARAMVDHALLEWLPQRLQGHPAELRRLVQEQDAVVGQADLPRPGDAPIAPDHGDVGRGVVRRAERRDPGDVSAPPSSASRIAATSSTCSSISGGNSPGSRCASMVLPTPGGPDRSTVMPPAAHLQRPAGHRWPRTSARSGNVPSGIPAADRAPRRPPRRMSTACARSSTRDDLQIGHPGDLPAVAGLANTRALSPYPQGHRDRAGDRSDRPVEPEFPEEHRPHRPHGQRSRPDAGGRRSRPPGRGRSPACARTPATDPP